MSAPIRFQFHRQCCKFLHVIILTGLLAMTAAAETRQLDNGMQVILKENHGSPMIASMVFVRSGSKYESRFENGITHFLEHLLFDGTANLSREEIDRSIRDLGGYINAFTRKELTSFIVLLPKQYITYGMTVQADMLFNSTFPENELPKERKVVIEEINRDADSPGSVAEAFFTEKAYAGTAYARPVLGYAPFIENIPRAAIVDYWRKYYRPENMTLLLIGDFDSDSMFTAAQQVFGKVALPGPAASPPKPQSPDYGAIVGKNVYDTVATVKSTYVKLSLPAPRWNDPDYLPFDLLVQYLNLDEISPLKQALLSGDKPMATEVDISLSTYAEFSRLDISVLTNDPARRGDILSTVLTTLQGMADYQADNEALDGIKTSVWTQAIYNADKLHYYGFLIAPMIFTAGWDFIQSYPDKLKAVAWQECRRAAEKWLGDPPYVATMIRPAQETDKTPFVPAGLTAEEVKAYFDTASIPQHELTAAVNLTFPEVDTVSFNLSSNATYHREVLPNGLTVLVKTSPSSRVFAVDILGKDRSANEPDSLIGITDFVNRCLEKGTLSRDAAALSRDLAKIGANLTLYDNPWIPYDDRYTTPQYSFIKFETIDEFASRGLGLLYDLVCYPAFDSAAVEQVRTQMLGIIARASGSPTKTARRLFYRTLFGAGAYARPVTGTKETISAIGIPDLRAYHRRFYAPNNMILSIVGNQPVEQIMDWVRATFGRLAPVKAEYRQGTPPQAVLAEKKVHVDMPSSQIGIYLGGALPGIHSEDATALSVAGAVLSAQLYGNLREKQGLAYSIGAGTAFDRDFGWWVCSMGTATGNYKKALTGLTLEIDKLRFDGPTPGDVRVARNHIWGRLMSAKLSRINQAYYMARDEFLGKPIDADPEFLKELQQVDAAAVRRVAATWFRTDAPIIATAGTIPADQPDTAEGK